MTKPTTADNSYSGIGDIIHRAGVHGNVIHNATQAPSGAVTFWFQKVKGQRRMGVANWLIETLRKVGDICLVDLYGDEKTPYAVTVFPFKGKAYQIPIDIDKLNEMIRVRGTIK